jgi:small subunit ribosomal protein S17
MRTKQGTITSAKMTGTVTVTIHRSIFHPLYKKRYRMSKKFLADVNGMEDLGVGDTVVITECRPLSKNKCFKVTEVVKRAPRVSEMKEDSAFDTKKKSTDSDSTDSK